MATIKGNGGPLTHQQMDENFQELNTARTDISNLQSTITSLQNQVNALQVELDTNQQSAENILTGIISRINVTKSQVITFRDEYQTLYNQLNSASGGTDIENLILTFVQTIITEMNNTITDLDSQIALLSEDFTI